MEHTSGRKLTLLEGLSWTEGRNSVGEQQSTAKGVVNNLKLEWVDRSVYTDMAILEN